MDITFILVLPREVKNDYTEFEQLLLSIHEPDFSLSLHSMNSLLILIDSVSIVVRLVV